MSSNTITGSCQCGAVRYEANAEPLFAGHCHCNTCKKASGAGHVSALFVPKDSFKITGETTKYTSIGDSGSPITRHFCPTCGSRLYGEPERAGNVVGIMVGTLDNPETFSPQFQIYTKNRTSWDHINCDLPEFEAAAPPQSE